MSAARTKLVVERIKGSIQSVSSLLDQAGAVERICGVVADAVRDGRMLATAGNGGSAAQASHLAEELIGRYRGPRGPLRATCLNADPTALTCIANDFGYEQVFARPCEALLGPGDVLVVLSTSGNSQNLLTALDAARGRGAVTVALLGKGGGPCRERADHSLVVGSEDSAHIQEAHLVIVHLICEMLED